ncbi:MAG: hypothetical protein JSU04_08815 [Bdellovibrionales bacterium]|nr:hypothetical protein [Bdellovibrionales bacterium]
MVDILAHRGYWIDPSEKNTLVAFKRALDNDFGIETDFRDREGRLFVAHDVNDKNIMLAEDFFSLPKISMVPLALNIKADGLQTLLKESLSRYNITNYFLFDASIPDLLVAVAKELNSYSRLSEYEGFSAVDEKTSGFWLDQFHGLWFTEAYIRTILSSNKKICIVSSELHKRDHIPLWNTLKKIYRDIPKNLAQNMQVCTDYPLEFRGFLNE